MGFFKTKDLQRQSSQPTYGTPNKSTSQLPQFDINSFMKANPNLQQQPPPPMPSQPQRSFTYGQPTVQNPGPPVVPYNGGRPSTSHGAPTPAHTPPPQPAPLNTAQAVPHQQFGMVYQNSITSPGVQDAYITQIPFQQQPNRMQQFQQPQQFIPPQNNRSSTYILPSAQVSQQAKVVNRRFSMQNMPPTPGQIQQGMQTMPPMPQFPSQLPIQANAPIPQQQHQVVDNNMHPQYQHQQRDYATPPLDPHYSPAPQDVVMTGSSSTSAQAQPVPLVPRNVDTRQADQDEIWRGLRPMNLTEYLTITGPEDICRHIPTIDRSEGTVSEFQHPDKESVVGQSYPLMNKLEWERPVETTFEALMSWNGRRLIPYPQQVLGRMIRCEEDVASISDDFWVKPVHAATTAWLQAIDSARSNGDYLKGLASRFTTSNYTNMDGLVEYGEDFDPSMLHFGKLFTLYPPVQQAVASSALRKQVVFFMEFASPGVLDAGKEIWNSGPVKALKGNYSKPLIHSYYSATRQIATTAKTTKCRAGCLSDYENLILFYFHGNPDTWTSQESQAEVVFLKKDDPHARYWMAELVYRSMSDMSEKLNIGDMRKVVEANGQLRVRGCEFMFQQSSVIH